MKRVRPSDDARLFDRAWQAAAWILPWETLAIFPSPMLVWKGGMIRSTE